MEDETKTNFRPFKTEEEILKVWNEPVLLDGTKRILRITAVEDYVLGLTVKIDDSWFSVEEAFNLFSFIRIENGKPVKDTPFGTINE